MDNEMSDHVDKATAWDHCVKSSERARAKALEEAAKIAQEMRDKHSSPTGDQYTCGAWDMAQRIIGKLTAPSPAETNRRVPERPELEALLKAAKAKVDAMSAEELEIMLAEQRESWVRGEMQLDRKPDIPSAAPASEGGQ